MARIHQLVRVVGFATAVKECLADGVGGFAGRAGVTANNVSGLINGSTPYPYRAIRDLLAEELVCSREWLDERLKEQRYEYLKNRNAGAGNGNTAGAGR